MRNKVTYTVTDSKSRDDGKTYVITEKSAYDAEKWAIRAFFVISNAGIDIPDDPVSLGMEGLVRWLIGHGLDALQRVQFSPEVADLLDDMMTCVRIMPDSNKPNVIRDLIQEDDIEEVKTRLILRREVIQAHLVFSPAVDPSTSGQAAQKG